MHPRRHPGDPGGNADADTLRRYDTDIDAEFEQARTGGDLTPLLDTVRRWWFEADTWRDPTARREYRARVSRYLADDPPPPARRPAIHGLAVMRVTPARCAFSACCR